MTARRLIDADITDRAANRAPVWDSAAATHKYVDLGDQVFSAARAKRTTSQTIGNQTHTAIIFDTTVFDTGDYHDTVTNPSRLTVPTDGYYEVTGNVTFTSADGGNRLFIIWKNSIATGDRLAIAGIPNMGAAMPTPQTLSTGPVFLEENDFVEVSAWQSGSSSLDLSLNPEPFLAIRRVG